MMSRFIPYRIPPMIKNVRWHLAALAIYAAESWVFLDRGASLTRQVLGSGPDPSLIMWFLAWWPWAFTHHAVAMHSHLLWQPMGVNLGWTTNVPLLALIALPVTLADGPILSFNLLTLAAPVLAGYGAFLLCLECFEIPVAALIGGWLFGFSSYEIVQSFDHLNLDFTVLIPLVLLVALRRLRGKTGRAACVFWLGILLAGEFMISDEILATSAIFGGLSFVLGYFMLPVWRQRLRVLALDLAMAAPLALALASPLLWPMLTGVYDVAHPAKWPAIFSTDLLNFILPTQATALGPTGIAKYFTGGLDEQAGYLGLPVILLILWAWRGLRQNPVMRLLYAMLGLVLLASLGASLHIAGRHTGIPLPWALLEHVPLLGAALPARVMLYASLLVALILAGWIAVNPQRPRILAGTVACVALLPVPHPTPAAPISAFFQPGRLQSVLGAHPRLLILPFAIAGPSSYWQAENQFGFSQAGGYLGFPPREMQAYPAVMQLFSNSFTAHFCADFVAYAHFSGAQFVIVGPGTPSPELAALKTLDWPAQKIDDVTMYTVPASFSAP
jgi:hypothetical protein